MAMSVSRYIENSDEVIEFRRWLRCKGFLKHQPLGFAELKDSGRGLVATRPIQAGEDIVRVPGKSIITAELASREYKWIQSLSQQAAIAVYLCIESGKALDSEWYPYLRMLPESFPTLPVNFESSGLFQLLPRDIQENSNEQSRRLNADWNNVLLIIPQNLVSSISWETFRWAWLVVHTRGITLNADTNEKSYLKRIPTIGLAPYLDCLNHHPYAQIQVIYDHDSDSLRLIAKQNTGPLSASKPTRSKTKSIFSDTEDVIFHRGDQVFIHYGPHDNHFLLAEYGFCASKGTNPWNQVVLDHILDNVIQELESASKHKSQNESFLQKALDVLKNQGWLGDIAVTVDDFVPFRLFQCLRLIICAKKADEMNHRVPRSIQKWGSDRERNLGSDVWKKGLEQWEKINLGVLPGMDTDLELVVRESCIDIIESALRDTYNRQQKSLKYEASLRDCNTWGYHFVSQILDEDIQILQKAITYLKQT